MITHKPTHRSTMNILTNVSDYHPYHSETYNRQMWNRCDVCGKFISYQDFAENKARRVLLAPDSYLTEETWETLCEQHNTK